MKRVDRSELPAVAVGPKPLAHGRNGHAFPRVTPNGQPRLRVRVVDGIAVVDFENAEGLFAEDVIQELGDRLYRLVDEGNSRLVLNFAGVHYMSCAFLGKLVGLRMRVKRIDGKLVLCGLEPALQDILRICHLERVFNIHVDEATSLRIIKFWST
jgi:anti-anti-sigma factor